MNSKMAKLIANAATALSMVAVAANKVRKGERLETLRLTQLQTVEDLKARWKGLPHHERPKMRRFMKETVRRARAVSRR